MAQSTQLSPVDAAWLHMEHPTNLMMITIAVLCRRPLDVDRVRAVCAERVLSFRRFRQRVVEPLTGIGLPSWEDDPTFNLDAHIHHIALPAPGSRRQLEDLLSDLASTPLDFSKPLWHLHVVDNVQIAPGVVGGAWLLRLHHAIGDGTALVAVAHRLFDTTPDAPVELPTLPKRTRSSGGGLYQSAAAVLRGVQSIMSGALQEGIESVRRPAHLLALAEEVAQSAQNATRRVTRSVSVAGRALVHPSDPATPLKGPLGVKKRVAWSDPIALDETKATARALGCTINDLMVAATAGALRHYLIERDTLVDGLDVHAMVPVDLRPPERALELGNVFGLVLLGMPIGLADPLARLKTVKQRMDALKRSNEALLYYSLLSLFGMTPKPVEEPVVDFFGSKATTVFTNVIGPRELCYLAGVPVERITFWVPQSGRLGMGISVYSYNQRITLGIITDEGLVPDPGRITEHFAAEFRTLARAAREAQAAAQTHTPPRCAAVNKTGTPCRNRALPGSTFCRLHQPLDA